MQSTPTFLKHYPCFKYNIDTKIFEKLCFNELEQKSVGYEIYGSDGFIRFIRLIRNSGVVVPTRDILKYYTIYIGRLKVFLKKAKHILFLIDSIIKADIVFYSKKSEQKIVRIGIAKRYFNLLIEYKDIVMNASNAYKNEIKRTFTKYKNDFDVQYFQHKLGVDVMCKHRLCYDNCDIKNKYCLVHTRIINSTTSELQIYVPDVVVSIILSYSF